MTIRELRRLPFDRKFIVSYRGNSMCKYSLVKRKPMFNEGNMYVLNRIGDYKESLVCLFEDTRIDGAGIVRPSLKAVISVGLLHFHSRVPNEFSKLEIEPKGSFREWSRNLKE